MWSNLLSGAIGSVLGSVLGVAGAYFLAVRTLFKTKENERLLIREQASVDSAGDIAVALIEFHDGLNELTWKVGNLTADDDVAIDSQMADFLWPAMADLSRKITVHKSMLDRELAAEVDGVRAAMREIFGVTAKSSVTKAQLIDMRERIRSARKGLSEFRRKAY